MHWKLTLSVVVLALAAVILRGPDRTATTQCVRAPTHRLRWLGVPESVACMGSAQGIVDLPRIQTVSIGNQHGRE